MGSRLPLRVVLLTAGLGLAAAPAGHAQAPDTTLATTLDDHLEAAAIDGDDDPHPEALAALLADLALSPLDVNTATAAQLAGIPGLTPHHAEAIVRYRKRYGPFGDLGALTGVEGLGPDDLRAARPFLRATPQTATAPPIARFLLIQRYTRRLDLRHDEAHAGAPDRVYTRARFDYGDRLGINLTLEKDPGEAFRWSPADRQYGYDYASGHIVLRGEGWLRQLIVGDFGLGYGQGLVFGRRGAPAKHSEAVEGVARRTRGLVPHGASDEHGFFRGVAAALRPLPHVTASAFASYRRLDAALIGTDDSLRAERLIDDGLHRTAAEVLQRDALGETVTGAAIAWSSSRIDAGVTGYLGRFDQPFVPAERLDLRHASQGRHTGAIGLHGTALWGDVLLFAEAAGSRNGGSGLLMGLTARLSPRADAAVLFRRYDPRFASRHGYAFAEQSAAPRNETGFYLGLRLRPSPRWTASAYFDAYRFPWPPYGLPRPGGGHEALVQVTHQPRRWLSVYLKGRTETRLRGTPRLDEAGRSLLTVAAHVRRSVRLHGRYDHSPRLRLQGRAEVVQAGPAGAVAHRGALLYQDLRWRPHERFMIAARLLAFGADNYDARLFAYEGDLLYTFSVPAFTGQGTRTYVLLRTRAGRGLHLEAKYARTRLQPAGSAPPSLRHELRVQLLLRV